MPLPGGRSIPVTTPAASLAADRVAPPGQPASENAQAPVPAIADLELSLGHRWDSKYSAKPVGRSVGETLDSCDRLLYQSGAESPGVGDGKMGTSHQHIETTPGIAGGKPRIAGHRITVEDIVIWHEHQGKSAVRIADEYDLTLAEVHLQRATRDGRVMVTQDRDFLGLAAAGMHHAGIAYASQNRISGELVRGKSSGCVFSAAAAARPAVPVR